MSLWQCCTQYASKFGKLSSGQRTGKVRFHSNPKGNAKECSNYRTIALISHYQINAQNSPSQALTIREPWTSRCSSQRSNCEHLLDHRKSKRVPENIYTSALDYTKAFDCVDHNRLWKILKEMGTPDHLTCLLRNLYAGQEATVRTQLGTTDWFQIGKELCQGCILSPCLLNFYVEYIMQNSGWSTSWNQDYKEKYQ